MNVPGVKFDIVWYDEDLLEFRILAASTTFSGETKVYVGHAEAAQFARDLAGFPASMADRREFHFESSTAGNRVSMVFVAPRLQIAVVDAEGSGQSAHVIVTIEAAAVDTFVRHFSTIARDRSGSAFLAGR